MRGSRFSACHFRSNEHSDNELEIEGSKAQRDELRDNRSTTSFFFKIMKQNMLVNNKNQERKGGHYQTLEKHPFLGRFAIQGRHIKTRPVPKENPNKRQDRTVQEIKPDCNPKVRYKCASKDTHFLATGVKYEQRGYRWGCRIVPD